MQLKITTDIRKSIISVELETINFCKEENLLLDQFGEPEFIFEKVYPGDYSVSIHKKIRSNFKVRLKFDGSKDAETMKKATEAVNSFIEEIQEKIDIFHDDWLHDKKDIMYDLKTGTQIGDIFSQDHKGHVHNEYVTNHGFMPFPERY